MKNAIQAIPFSLNWMYLIIWINKGHLLGVPPHAHQANILKCPQNEKTCKIPIDNYLILIT
ncbi:hypothetical protein DX930_27755 [Bacillus cereus]|nr:hypothetical protein DX930_27755 [Bacillus cereus]